MGLAALKKILEVQPLDVSTLRGKAVAVDADNLVWQFVTAIAGASGTVPKGAHLIGLANRLRLYADLGLRSAWIFDGEQPALKAGTLAGRAERIAQSGSVSVSQQDLDECKALLGALGVPWMVAPAESDAQCAHFARRGDVWAAVTQDWDIALHGAPRAIRNLSGSKTKQPELLDLEASLASAALTREQLVDIAVLIGTDYNEGVRGVGPVKALKLVRERGNVHAALRALGVDMPEADAVRALFLAHEVDERARLAWAAPDDARVREVAAQGGLSERRAEEVASALRALHAGA